MTRSNPGILFPIDPEIEGTLHRLARANQAPSSDTDSLDSISLSSSDTAKEIMDAQLPPPERTLREMAAPDFTYQNLCIQYPEEEVPYVLKTGLIHLLPKFHGLAGEDPHKHLKEFTVVCASMKPHNVEENHLFLKAFPHTLEGAAKDWLYYLAPGSITGWDDLRKGFLEKFFPASRTTAIRKEISGIKQLHGETLYEYWERFKKLCASCPHHQISDQLLLQYFYEGLNNVDRSLVDAASGGALGDMTVAAARAKIETMASNSQQFGARGDAIIRDVHDLSSNPSIPQLEKKLDNLTTMVTQLALNQKSVTAKLCELCTSPAHPTDACPKWQDQGAFEVNAFGHKPPQQQQQNWDLSTNKYNPSWQNHPKLRYGNSSNQQQFEGAPFQNQAGTNGSYVPPHQRSQQMVHNPPQTTGPSLEEMMKQMAAMNMQFQQGMGQFQQETKASIQRQEASIQNLTNQMGQLATTVSNLQAQNSDRLPSQPIINSRNVSAIQLRSGKEIDVPLQNHLTKGRFDVNPERRDDPVVIEGAIESQGTTSSDDKAAQSKEEEPEPVEKDTNVPSPSTKSGGLLPPHVPLPFPPRAVPSKKAEEADKAILDTFRKIEVNIPLLEIIGQIPKYAKFLKDLCTQKRKLKGNERISMGRNVSALIGKPASHIPEKCEDPGTFSIPCVIGNCKFESAMLDLGASINVMPMTVYKYLSLGPLKPTGVVIQLANRSTTYPAGVIEDVLVRVNELVFPADFYVLEMEDGSPKIPVPIILGRPFLKTAKTKIDVYSGSLSMEVGDTMVKFDIFKAMRNPPEDQSVFHIDIIDDLVDEHWFDFMHDVEELDVTDSLDCPECTDYDLCGSCIDKFLDGVDFNAIANPMIEESTFSVSTEGGLLQTAPLVPSVLQAPKLELKPLPENLKYVYLEDDEQLPVIISTLLDADQEKQLLHVLRRHKKAIGWTIADIPGISPATCMHRIFLEEGAKPVRQPQRRLNPVLLEVVKKEMIKLLMAGIIFPIATSQHENPALVDVTVEELPLEEPAFEPP